MLTFDELCARLGIPRAQLTALVRKGLPHQVEKRKKIFDPHQVRAWLIEQGLATIDAPAPSASDQRIARTRGEVARELGVSVRTVAEWLLDPSFPGKPGPPGRRDGHFPLEAIADWWAKKQGSAPLGGALAGESPRERLLRLRADQEEIELAKLRGDVVQVIEVERLLRRTIATAKSILAPLSDELLQDLPAGIGDDVREQLRERSRRRLEEAFTAIADSLAGDDDPTTDTEE